MRGLQRIDRVEIDFLAVPAAVIAKSNMPGRALFLPLARNAG